MAEHTLYTKIETLPADLKKEAIDFIDFLIQKRRKKKIGEKPKKPVFGNLKGKIKLSADFDDPLDVFEEYM